MIITSLVRLKSAVSLFPAGKAVLSFGYRFTSDDEFKEAVESVEKLHLPWIVEASGTTQEVY